MKKKREKNKKKDQERKETEQESLWIYFNLKKLGDKFKFSDIKS